MLTADGSFDFSDRREILLFHYSPRYTHTQSGKLGMQDRITIFLRETDNQIPTRQIPYENILNRHLKGETRVVQIRSKVPYDLFKINVQFNRELREKGIGRNFIDTPLNEATPPDVIDLYIVGKCPQHYTTIAEAFEDVCRMITEYEFGVYGFLI